MNFFMENEEDNTTPEELEEFFNLQEKLIKKQLEGRGL